MPSTARAAWLDAWEGPSTPSPSAYHSMPRRSREERRTQRQAWERSLRYREREATRKGWERSLQPVSAPGSADSDGWGYAEIADQVDDGLDEDHSVVRISSWQAAREREEQLPGSRARPKQGRRGKPKSPSAGRSRGSRMDTRTRESLHMPEVAPIVDYDWEAAARRRPRQNECERVILHADRSVEARMSSARHYGREATARIPEPWPEARRRETAPRPRLVKRRTPRWRLGLLAVSFAVFLVGTGVVTPVLINSAVTGVETAVGRAEAEQAQLAAETAALEAQISSLSSPQRVAEEAAHLGLVPANEVSYLSSGTPLLASEGDTEVAGR